MLIKYSSLLSSFTKWIYLAKPWPWDLNRMSTVSANWVSLHTKLDRIEYFEIQVFCASPFPCFFRPDFVFFMKHICVWFSEAHSCEPDTSKGWSLPEVDLWRCDEVQEGRKADRIEALDWKPLVGVKMGCLVWAPTFHHKGYRTRLWLVFTISPVLLNCHLCAGFTYL